MAYFDGPGGTQVPRSVVDAMSRYLLHHNANTHWAYPTSVETDAVIAGAREALADFLNASPGEIAFGQNMTSLTFHLSRALGRGMKAGSEIVVTDLDHRANVDPWLEMARDFGLKVRSVRVNLEDGRLDMNDLRSALEGRPALLAIGAASNALGTITDVAEASRMAHEAGALVFVDAVHYAPHELVDVRGIDCDFLACSPYKFYGPHLGVLYGRRELLEKVQVPKLKPSPDTAPERMETGTLSHEAIAGAAASVEFLASAGGSNGSDSDSGGTSGNETEGASSGRTRRERLTSSFAQLHQRGEQLLARLWTGLEALDGVTLHGPRLGTPRTPTVSFTVRGKSSAEVAESLAAAGVFASNGDFYASTIVRLLGHEQDGLLRAGCACYTTEEEVDRLISAVQQL